MSDYVTAAILGIVEGLTEFLPISSTGHLILAEELLGAKGTLWETFEIMIQLGAILAVVVLYFRKLWSTLVALPTDPAARHFAIVLLIALIPSLALGAAFSGIIKELLFNPLVVGLSLIGGGLIIVLVEQMGPKPLYHATEEVPYRTGLLVGLAQACSLMPGVSRSGATIIGGLVLGLDRKTAAEFSFFLAIPTMGAAFVHEAWKYRATLDFDTSGVIAVGFVTSFVSAILVVKPFLAYVSRNGFMPFAYYRVAAGVLVLTLLYF